MPASALGTGVYPRVCGGNPATDTTERDAMGLSPRVRGKLASGMVAVPGQRSIPACAGETDQIYVEFDQGMVYPRVCGGNNGAWH